MLFRSPSTYLNAAKFTSLNGTATITAVCVRAQGFATTSATGSTTVTGGWDGSTSATCPANFTAVGGGASFAAKDLKGNGVSVPQAVSSLTPIDNKTFGVEIRGAAWEPPQSPSGRGLIDIPAGNYAVPLVYYAKHDTTGVTVTAICAQRVLG